MAEPANQLRPGAQSRPQDPGPAVIPDHQLLRLIARGSYGEVWLARNSLGTYRAVKIVHQSTFRDPRPFERELSGVQKFEPVSRLHEGLMDVLQVGRHPAAGYFYCVMELADDAVRGQSVVPDGYTPRTLALELAGGKRLPVEVCLQVGITICSALGFLHARGLIHRDVKPSNIVFVQGIPKLADIGLVAELSEARSYVGTEGFIPPEGPGTVQADLYSLGKVLYEMSTGKDRYDFPELPTLLDETTHGRELLELNKVILKACRAEPRLRYRSTEEMLADLQALQRGERLPARWGGRRWVRLGLRCAGLMAGVGLLGWSVLGRWHHGGQLQAATAKADTLHPVAAPPGLVAWWRGENDLRDEVGGNHGRAVFNEVSFGPGKVGRAIHLDGISNAVIVPAASNLILDSFTIEGWIFPVDIGLPRPILEFGGTHGQRSVVHLWYSVAPGVAGIPGALYGAIRDRDGLRHFDVATSGGVLSANQWSHVALTFDATVRQVLLYVNGLMLGSNTAPAEVHPDTFAPLFLGYRSGESSDLWAGWRHSGQLDEISIYNRALSGGEIRSVYQAGAAGKSLVTPTSNYSVTLPPR